MKQKDQNINKVLTVLTKQPKIKKVYLFGSRVKGNAKKNSDYDLMIIKDSKENKYDSTVSLYKLFPLEEFSLDFIVYTSKDMNYWKNTPGSFIHHVLSTGKLLYEKK